MTEAEREMQFIRDTNARIRAEAQAEALNNGEPAVAAEPIRYIEGHVAHAKRQYDHWMVEITTPDGEAGEMANDDGTLIFSSSTAALDAAEHAITGINPASAGYEASSHHHS